MLYVLADTCHLQNQHFFVSAPRVSQNAMPRRGLVGVSATFIRKPFYRRMYPGNTKPSTRWRCVVIHELLYTPTLLPRHVAPEMKRLECAAGILWLHALVGLRLLFSPAPQILPSLSDGERAGSLGAEPRKKNRPIQTSAPYFFVRSGTNLMGIDQKTLSVHFSLAAFFSASASRGGMCVQ